MNYIRLLIILGIIGHVHFGNAQSFKYTVTKDTASIWQLFKHDFKYTAKGVGHSLTDRCIGKEGIKPKWAPYLLVR